MLNSIAVKRPSHLQADDLLRGARLPSSSSRLCFWCHKSRASRVSDCQAVIFLGATLIPFSNPPAQAGKPLASTSIEAFPNVVVEVVTAVAPPVASMEPAEPIAVTPVDSKVDEADVVAPEISIIGSTSAGALPGANAVPVTLIGSTVETGSLAEGQHVLEPSHEGSADLYST